MEISATQIKELREITGAGVLDCRKALSDTGGDLKKAVVILREKGLAAAAKRADRASNNGTVENYSHGGGRVGVMVEVNCETDFVARTEEFRRFAHEVALQIAAAAPKYIDNADVPAGALEEQRANARTLAMAEGKPENEIDKLVEDRVAKFYAETCLMKQPYIRDETLTVGELHKQAIVSTRENVVIRRFVRWELGEGSE